MVLLVLAYVELTRKHCVQLALWIGKLVRVICAIHSFIHSFIHYQFSRLN